MTETLPTGDRLERNRDAAVLTFTGKRKVLSTGALGGGLTEHMAAVFNRNDCPRAGKWCEMRGTTMAEHQAHTAAALGLDPLAATGLNTAANIDNTAGCTLCFGDFSVTALVTAGLEVNACRVGNEAGLHEYGGEIRPVPGTVNIILVVDADLSDGCMARALVTCTEAKVAALQELVVSDRYSPGLATGSGTDGTVIISNSESPVKLCEAGEHYKLGELIGKAVMRAVKDALFRHSGLCEGTQHSVFRRLERFGVTERAIWEEYLRQSQQPVERELFSELMGKMSADGSIVSLASLYAHLIDQLRWGMLLPVEVADTGNRMLELMDIHHNMQGGPRAVAGDDRDALAQSMADAFIQTVTRWVLGS